MFVGRKDSLADLETLWRKRTSSIVACRGRRRIGKSTLFREFSRQTADAYIEIEGLPPSAEMTNQKELDHFAAMLADQTNVEYRSPARWYEAFSMLERAIDDSKRTVIMLDEISWMGKYDDTFPGVLRSAWESLFHRHDRLILVVCGSVSSWIQKNILNNTGFTGRFSRDYVLPELSLDECAEVWDRKRNRIDDREIFDVLSVTGGVPRYLEEIDPGLSADENIRRLCFLSSGELYKDFDAIFDPELDPSVPLKRQILELLSNGPKSGAELAATIGEGRNGRFSEILKELALGGFITDDMGKNPATGKDIRIGTYRLKDNYTRFYLKYIAPHKQEIALGTYKYIALEHLSNWHAIMGLQFENLIVNNAMDVVPHLGLGAAIVESAAPFRNKHCQIDLLVQTARSAYVVEVKRKQKIDSSIEEEVERKVKSLKVRRGASVRTVLVYDGVLEPRVEGAGFFDAIVRAGKLLG